LSNVTYLRPRHSSMLTEHVARAIRSGIVSGEFDLGEPLSETQLAARFGVGRTPIHEAFLRLKAEGLIEIEPQRGTFVFDMSAGEVRELCEMREVLEIAAARFAIRRRPGELADALDEINAAMQDAFRSANIAQYRMLDNSYHKRIIEHAGNSFLQASYDAIAFRIQALRNRLSLDPVLNRQAIRDHRAFAVLVRAGEIYRASTRLSDHIRLTGSNYLRVAGLEG
jgi:DNA-binding GntR family transcriptional regulator